MHADGQAGAALDEERDVFPKVIPAKANQRIARRVRPVRGLDNFAHHWRMPAGERLDLLVVVVKAG